jgi:hypothetical protein
MTVRRSRLVLSVWMAWLMNQPFRLLGAAHKGFGPGFKAALYYTLARQKARFWDTDRMKWRLLQWRHRVSSVLGKPPKS